MIQAEPKLQGLLYDMEYSLATVAGMANVPDHFTSIHNKLRNCIFLKQQIDYNESIRRRVAENLQKQAKAEAAEESSSSSLRSASVKLRSNKSQPSATSSKTNHFSTSFDFTSPSSFIASSVSTDGIKSLISSLRKSSVNSNGGDSIDSSTSEQAAAASGTMTTLVENVQIETRDQEQPEQSLQAQNNLN